MEMGKLLLCKERQAQYFLWCGKSCHGDGEAQSTQGNVCHGEGQRSPGRPHSFPCLGVWHRLVEAITHEQVSPFKNAPYNNRKRGCA